MLFNSYVYIFAFLPVTFLVYFFLNKKKLTTASNAFLLASSLFFYAWWNVLYLPLLIGSILFNYVLGVEISKHNRSRSGKFINRKFLFLFGIIANLGLLGYFKYSNFFIGNLNWISHSHFSGIQIILPLAISFFTFNQVAYLVDSYKGEVKEANLLNYALFVTFFPHLIAGPIVHHKEMMPQFARQRNKFISYENIAAGLFLISMGLFKKVIIADTFAQTVKAGFDEASVLTLTEAWITSLSYTFQIYFDFSGYMDMALGSALLFNIKFPLNFNAPYKALNIQDFWKRWHMTLSRFLRDYLYIPLGGNRINEYRTSMNVMITFVLGGFWHGASWTFVFWGLLHGIAVIIHRIWSKSGFRMNAILAWFITFNFVNISWVFFRAKDFHDALKVIKSMFGFEGVVLPGVLKSSLGFLASYGATFEGALQNIHDSGWIYTYLALAFIVIFLREPLAQVKRLNGNYVMSCMAGILLVVSLYGMNRLTEFIYFNF